MTALFARALLLCGSLACAAWLAGELGPVRDELAALELTRPAGRRASAADLDRANRLLAQAAASTRSREPDLRRAELLVFARRDAPAVRVLVGIVRAEPANAEAWGALARAAAGSDPALAARARARFRALSPSVPTAR
ncbi:MAG TPA: hypothetical protein VES79_04395 [Solirubrobacteraceae bacterium]|nr:hypothetical protein [Solirubrobacteraceae bacterium]